ncbi:MAG: GFA family protein [Woeseiaceae bacterium]
MLLEGSCHCGGVKFQLNSPHPYPFNLCYCSICRKTTGGGGYAINLGAEFSSLEVEGEDNLSVYRATIEDKQTGKQMESDARRHFCKLCGSALWLWDPRWPELVHPLASAIDSDLPIPPERTHLMVGSKASWVEQCDRANDKVFDEYPDESIAAWHERLGFTE